MLSICYFYASPPACAINILSMCQHPRAICYQQAVMPFLSICSGPNRYAIHVLSSSVLLILIQYCTHLLTRAASRSYQRAVDPDRYAIHMLSSLLLLIFHSSSNRSGVAVLSRCSRSPIAILSTCSSPVSFNISVLHSSSNHSSIAVISTCCLPPHLYFFFPPVMWYQ